MHTGNFQNPIETNESGAALVEAALVILPLILAILSFLTLGLLGYSLARVSQEALIATLQTERSTELFTPSGPRNRYRVNNLNDLIVGHDPVNAGLARNHMIVHGSVNPSSEYDTAFVNFVAQLHNELGDAIGYAPGSTGYVQTTVALEELDKARRNSVVRFANFPNLGFRSVHASVLLTKRLIETLPSQVKGTSDIKVLPQEKFEIAVAE